MLTAPEVVARRGATLADLEALPEMIKGEIIESVLYTQGRPAFGHSRTPSKVLADARLRLERQGLVVADRW